VYISIMDKARDFNFVVRIDRQAYKPRKMRK